MNDYLIEVQYEGPLDLDILKKDETIFHVANGLIGKKGFFTEGYGENQKNTVVMNGFYNSYPYFYEEHANQFPSSGKTIMPLPEPFQFDFYVDGIIINQKMMTHVKTYRVFDLLKGQTRRQSVYKNPKGQSFQINETIFADVMDMRKIHMKLECISLDTDITLDVHHKIRMPHIEPTTKRDPRVAYERNHLHFLESTVKDNEIEYVFETMSKQFKGSFKTKTNLDLNYSTQSSDVDGRGRMTCYKNMPINVTIQVLYDTNHIKLPYPTWNVDSYENDERSQIAHFKSFWESQRFSLHDDHASKALRYHMYQLYCSGGVLDELSIAAKGLSGEGYEGHYFWDTEMYMLPYFVMHHPKRAKHILKHRLIHLSKAKQEAKLMGVLKGAKIPWRTIDGSELSPYFPAGSSQLHINSAVAYGYILYVETTQDDSILCEGGFELLVELGLYIVEYGFFDEDGFHLPLVTGPDEYTPLVYDNYYTNKLAALHLKYVIDHYDTYKHVLKEPIDAHTFMQIKDAVKTMTFLYDETLGIHLQDRDHLNRKPLPNGFLPNEGLPLLLKHHPHVIYRHRVLKQADSISADIMTHQYDKYFKNSYYHYLAITSHDSSLSKCIYGVGAYQLLDNVIGDAYFKDVLFLDFEDKKKHTKHGLHLANSGGAYLMFMKGLLGIHTIFGLFISPTKSETYPWITYQFMYKNQSIFIELKKDILVVKVEKQVHITIWNHVYVVNQMLKVERPI